MNPLKIILLIVGIAMSYVATAQKSVNVDNFDKIIVSPHIETTFVASDENRVQIESSTEDESKINIEVSGGTLRVYLDGAKEWTKSEKVDKNGHKRYESLYKGKVVTATIYFKNLEKLSIRGEQHHKIEGGITSEDFDLTIYGESTVDIDQIASEDFKLVTYGESIITVGKGEVSKVKITTYGESQADLLAVNTTNAKVTSYGESEIKLNVSDEIKVSSYGESKLQYKGNAVVKKGLTFGDSSIIRL